MENATEWQQKLARSLAAEVGEIEQVERDMQN